MIYPEKRVAVITSQDSIADKIKAALKDLFAVDIYSNGLALNLAMGKASHYKAIITDDELLGTNGISLQKALQTQGYGKIPFIALINQIDIEQRKLAMKEGVAEIFSKPVDEKALRLRVPYVIENYNAVIKDIAAPRYKLPLFKRIFDIVFSGLALLLLSPLFLVIAIFNKSRIEGPGILLFFTGRLRL